MKSQDFTTKDLAERLGVTDRTIRYWIDAKLIFPSYRTLKGHNRFTYQRFLDIKSRMESSNEK